MASSTVENYLKTLYIQQQPLPGRLVPMGKLAEAMGVAPGTATAMVKTLTDSGLVDYEPRNGVKLTRRGEALALHVLRRHRLIELFLVEVLQLDWSEVHDEAEELEHAISDKVLEKIDLLLGHPTVDPHGDPIPTSRGHLPETALASLLDCAVDKTLRIRRIIDQDPAFLQFVDRNGLTPGTHLVVHERSEAADAVRIHLADQAEVTLGTIAAAKILVEPA